MKILLKGANVFGGDGFSVGDILISDGVIVRVGGSVSFDSRGGGFDCSVDLSGKYIFPGFTDVHTHLREPGFSYKETIKTGTAAAAAGGFTTICAMPNLNPSPDCREGLDAQLALIRESACINVLPYGSITKGSLGERLADFEDMPDAVAFTDDGRGTTIPMLMAAMERVKRMGKIVCSHCEDLELKGGDHIADGAARRFGFAGISNESEFVQLERELEAAEAACCRYHMCHISCRESVGLIRRAKARGLEVTCETAPHYIALDYNDILSDDGMFKMNPPLRSPEDRAAIIEGLLDGTIDMIATDHAPHSAEEKGKGLAGSTMGVVGLETAFAACYTALVRKEILTLERLVELMSVEPNRRFGIGSCLREGERADLTVFDLDKRFIVAPASFKSLGRSTPFEGRELWGECLMTICGGAVVYEKA